MSWTSIFGLLSYIISFFIYIIIIPRYNLSYIIPLTIGITQILIILIAYFVFHEDINVYRILGILTIIVGVILMNLHH